NELAVAPITHAHLARPVPQITAGGGSDLKPAFAWVRVFLAVIVSIAQGPHFLDVIRGISTHAPFVAVGADFAVHVEIVEQNKLAGGLVVGGSSLPKERNGGWVPDSFFPNPLKFGHFFDSL